MKHCRSLLCALLAALLTGCGAVSPQSAEPAQEGYTFFDALGYETTLTSWDRVVSLYGSFAEAWTLAGGTLVGAASDAVEERGLPLGQDTAVVGSVKEPNLEKVLAADPDFVILSADITGQVGLHQALTDAGIPHAYFRTDTFSEYLTMLELFCSMTGREDLYQQNGLVVQEEIDRVKAAVQGQPRPTALLIRAYSTGAKAKGADNLAGVILRDLGADNLAARRESLLEELSLEEIIAADPDFIFLTTMGASDDAALAYMEDTFAQNPAWSELSAVKNGRYVLLPRELFHYKPNARWGESYAYLAKILYPALPASSPKERAAVLALLAAALCAGAALSLRCGAQDYTAAQLLAALDGGDETVRRILVHVRLPRTLAAAMAGSALALSGALIQAVLNNTMASPNVIGVNAGAGFASMLAATVSPGGGWMPAASFLGALCTALLIYLLAARAGLSRTTLILAGIAVSSILTAGINTITLLFPGTVAGSSGFLLGGFSGVTLAALRRAAGYLAAGTALAGGLAVDLNILQLGEESAAGLGLFVGRTRFLSILAAALLAGAAVSFAGLLGFVGLLVPHMAVG